MNIMDGLESLKVSHLVGIPRRGRLSRISFFSPLYLHGMDSSVSPKEACQECSGSPHLILIKKLGRWVFFTKGRIFLVFGFVDHGLVGNPSIRGLIDGQ